MKTTTLFAIILMTTATLHITAQGSWSPQESGFGMATYFKSIQFIDHLEGWAVGDNIILHTIDGGNNWIHQDSDVFNTDTSLESVYFVNELEGWAVGRQGFYDG